VRILIRDSKSKQWAVADTVKAKAESELQKLLIESPSLIAIDEIRDGASKLVTAIGEFGLPGSGSTDLLAFSAQGDIALVECKLAANQEIKRKVIGQILEYAAYLWQMTYEQVDEKIKGIRGKALAELVAESIAADWDEELFRNNVRQNLETGSFMLVIVVDEINEELNRIIKYINENSKSTFSLHALEMNRFKADTIEILVPHLHGIALKTSTANQRKGWNEERLLKALAERNTPDIANAAKELYYWAKENADRIWFGQGIETGSFTFHFLKAGGTVAPFTLYTTGTLAIDFGYMNGILSQETLKQFHEKITKIPTMSHIPFNNKYPSVKADALKDVVAFKKFKEAILWLRDQPTLPRAQ
jgi:hypothetical protein